MNCNMHIVKKVTMNHNAHVVWCVVWAEGEGLVWAEGEDEANSYLTAPSKSFDWLYDVPSPR